MLQRKSSLRQIRLLGLKLFIRMIALAASESGLCEAFKTASNIVGHVWNGTVKTKKKCLKQAFCGEKQTGKVRQHLCRVSNVKVDININKPDKSHANCKNREKGIVSALKYVCTIKTAEYVCHYYISTNFV